MSFAAWKGVQIAEKRNEDLPNSRDGLAQRNPSVCEAATCFRTSIKQLPKKDSQKIQKSFRTPIKGPNRSETDQARRENRLMEPAKSKQVALNPKTRAAPLQRRGRKRSQAMMSFTT